MKRVLLFAGIAGILVVAAVGTSVALGFSPSGAVSSWFDDPCDAPDAPAGNATAAADPCGDGDGESQDDSS